MSRPEVSLEGNLPEIYEYYDMAPNVAVTKGVHWLCSQLFKPVLSTDDGVREKLQRTLGDEEDRVVLSVNHVSNFDPFVAASVMRRLAETRPMIAQTIIPSKPEYFRSSKTRWLWDAVGAKPVFREKDSSGSTVDNSALRREAGNHYVDLVSRRMVDEGEHLAGFFEGSRNKGNPNEVQPISSGIRRISENLVEAGVRPVVFPLAIYYGPRGQTRWHHPRAHMGSPLPVESIEDCASLRDDMRQSLQEALDQAADDRIAPHKT